MTGSSPAQPTIAAITTSADAAASISASRPVAARQSVPASRFSSSGSNAASSITAKRARVRRAVSASSATRVAAVGATTSNRSG